MNTQALLKFISVNVLTVTITLLSGCGKQSSEEDKNRYKPLAQNSTVCIEASKQNDVDTAISTCLKEAYMGDQSSEIVLAKLYQQKEDWEHASQWYQLAAVRGDHDAQHQLAMIYLDGKGRYPDARVAINWFLEAARSGYVPSQWMLAKLYHDGKKVEKNDYVAFQWYLACANQEPSAAFEVGLAYLIGEMGQQRNLDLGIRYLSYAARRDNTQAKALLEKIIAQANQNEDSTEIKNPNKSIQLIDSNIEKLSKAAKSGSSEEQLTLGKSLMQYSIPQYDRAALYWVTQSAKQGNVEAKYWLAHCYQEGIGTQVDYDNAFAIYSELALTGHPLAQFQLGKMYCEGQGIEQDDLLGRKWIQQAATQGIEEANTLLARINEKENENTDEDH